MLLIITTVVAVGVGIASLAYGLAQLAGSVRKEAWNGQRQHIDADVRQRGRTLAGVGAGLLVLTAFAWIFVGILTLILHSA